MNCRRTYEVLDALAGCLPERVPADVTGHLQFCGECQRRVAGARLARHALAAFHRVVEPPSDFAQRIMGTLRVRSWLSGVEDFWRFAWELMPAFAVIVGVLYFMSPADLVQTTSFFPLQTLSPPERLILDMNPPSLEEVARVLLFDNTK